MYSDAVLVYADDGGRTSFVLLSISNGSVMARINVATSITADDLAAASSVAGSRDHASIKLTVSLASRPVNDRHWHTVTLYMHSTRVGFSWWEV